MTGYELEIALHRRDGRHWAVEMRFEDPATDGENRLVPQESLSVSFDFDKLAELSYTDMDEYGRVLGRSLLSEQVGAAFGEARAAAERQGQPLRVRLFVGPSAPELHELRWETLRDPETDVPLATTERILFSRFLTSLDWRAVGARPKTDLRALVVVANPDGLDEYESDERRLPPIDVQSEVDRSTSALAQFRSTVMARRDDQEPTTFDRIVAALRNGYDVLYFVCHGYIARGEPQLLLENERGLVQRVTGSELVAAVRNLDRTPRLIVLASCQSAGGEGARWSADQGALASLGPRLAEAGVPAVLAMQGNVSMATMERFVPAFFKELERDGRIDRAVALARWGVRNRPDWWAPALYMRLKKGRLWYSPGFVSGTEFENWPQLISHIRSGACTPLLGPGLDDPLIGTRQHIAERWASTYSFPMEPHYQDDLPHVAQYLAVKFDDVFLRGEIVDRLRREISERYGGRLPPEMARRLYDHPLDEILLAVRHLRNQEGAFDAYGALADMPFPLYLTTQPSTLLETSLTAKGRTPRVGICPWNDDLAREAGTSTGAEPRPTADEPYVYHLFGTLDNPESMVITEDDYFDYLMGVTANRDLIPNFVPRALIKSALLFLGFRLDEWDFRVLFRSLMNQQGDVLRKGFRHVAVQIDPEEGRTLEPDRARRYLERYFGDNRIDIYWGRTDDFVRALSKAWGDDR